MTIINVIIQDLYEDLMSEHDESSEKETFSTSKGWFERFKRHILHDIKVSGEATSADTGVVNNYPLVLKKITEEGGYTPQQVFNVNETGLYWKHMPVKTFISSEEMMKQYQHSYQQRNYAAALILMSGCKNT